MTALPGTVTDTGRPAPNPLITLPDTTVPWYAGITLVEGIADLRRGIASESWVSSTIGGLFVGVDSALLLLDPLGSMASWLVAICLEHIRPLAQWLDLLAGDPQQITANAQTWYNTATATRAAMDALRDAVWRDVPGWQGDAATAYRNRAAVELVILRGLAEACEAKAEAVRLSGAIVLVVRTLVRDLIADCVATLAVRCPLWTIEAGVTLGFGIPWVAAQVGALVAKWAVRIAKVTDELVQSLHRLTVLVRQVDEHTQRLVIRPYGDPLPGHAGPGVAGPPPRDLDGDGRPDVLDPDADADGVLDSLGYVPPPRSGGPELPSQAMSPNLHGETDWWMASQLYGRLSPGVRYLTPDEAEQLRVFVRDGMLYGTDGRAVTTTGAALDGGDRAIFVMDPQGNVYLSTDGEVGVFHHSSFLGGQPVAAAGEMVVENGRIVMVNNVSGHYRTPPEFLQRFLDELQAAGMDVSGIVRELA